MMNMIKPQSLVVALLVKITFFLTPALASNPYKIVLLFDERSGDTAAYFTQYIRMQSPFREMGSQLEIVSLKARSSLLKCRNACAGQPEREPCCDKEYAIKMGAAIGANRVLIIQSAVSGGSGSPGDGVAIASTKKPINVGLHELMHSWGFADEYPYGEDDANVYCTPKYMRRKRINLVYIAPQPPYSSDAQARQRHASQIPWYDDIAHSTPISGNGDLGTPFDKSFQKIGLYASAAECSGKVPAWVPTTAPNVMSTYIAPITALPPIYQKKVIEVMERERGEKFDFIKTPPSRSFSPPKLVPVPAAR